MCSPAHVPKGKIKYIVFYEIVLFKLYQTAIIKFPMKLFI